MQCHAVPCSASQRAKRRCTGPMPTHTFWAPHYGCPHVFLCPPHATFCNSSLLARPARSAPDAPARSALRRNAHCPRLARPLSSNAWITRGGIGNVGGRGAAAAHGRGPGVFRAGRESLRRRAGRAAGKKSCRAASMAPGGGRAAQGRPLAAGPRRGARSEAEVALKGHTHQGGQHLGALGQQQLNALGVMEGRGACACAGGCG